MKDYTAKKLMWEPDHVAQLKTKPPRVLKTYKDLLASKAAMKTAVAVKAPKKTKAAMKTAVAVEAPKKTKAAMTTAVAVEAPKTMKAKVVAIPCRQVVDVKAAKAVARATAKKVGIAACQHELDAARAHRKRLLEEHKQIRETHKRNMAAAKEGRAIPKEGPRKVNDVADEAFAEEAAVEKAVTITPLRKELALAKADVKSLSKKIKKMIDDNKWALMAARGIEYGS